MSLQDASPSVICIDPQATAEHCYRVIAKIIHRDERGLCDGLTAIALVLVPCVSMTILDRAVGHTLGDRWIATRWHLAA